MLSKALNKDLEDASDILTNLKARWKKYTVPERVDITARLKAVAKSCKELDELMKEEVKTLRKGKPGEVLGEAFKAVLKETPTTRLNQGRIKEEFPKAYQECLEDAVTYPVTFEAR